MAGVSERQAIDLARTRLELGPEARARVFEVDRVASFEGSYYLLVFDEAGEAGGLAAVDAASGEVTNWATLPGGGAPIPLDAESARDRSGLGQGSRTRLVWTSFRGSRSPLYPVWEVSEPERTVYVDQQGGVWTSLAPSTRGGGGQGSGRSASSPGLG